MMVSMVWGKYKDKTLLNSTILYAIALMHCSRSAIFLAPLLITSVYGKCNEWSSVTFLCAAIRFSLIML